MAISCLKEAHLALGDFHALLNAGSCMVKSSVCDGTIQGHKASTPSTFVDSAVICASGS
jgi:hypothetical protein